MSVVLINGPVFSSASNELSFEADPIDVVNVGSTSRTFMIADEQRPSDASLPGTVQRPIGYGASNEVAQLSSGDRTFLSNLAEVPEGVRRAGELLLSKIRSKFPGDLKVYEQRRYFNSPDNFWGVQIQVRKEMLKVWVRGVPDRLPMAGLDVWLDRPPVYSAFKVSHVSEVPKAMAIIEAAERKF